MNASETELRRKLEALQNELAARQSVVHFAHMGVSIVIAVIVAGAACKLVWDSTKYWWIGGSVALVAMAMSAYAVVQYKKGRRHLRRELDLFQTLVSVRKALRLDDPEALLPS